MARDETGLDLTSEWRVDVTDDDIRAARAAWLSALEAGSDSGRVEMLHRGYERLVRTQGRQISEALQRRLSR